MKHVDIINRIVEAEQRARQIAAEAQEKLAHLQADLENERKNLRETYLQRAERRVEMVREREQALMREQLDEMDKHFTSERDMLERLFADHRTDWVDKLFTMVTER